MKKVVLILLIAAALAVACNNNTDGDKHVLPADAPRNCTQPLLDNYLLYGCHGVLPRDSSDVHRFIYDQQCDCER